MKCVEVYKELYHQEPFDTMYFSVPRKIALKIAILYWNERTFVVILIWVFLHRRFTEKYTF